MNLAYPDRYKKVREKSLQMIAPLEKEDFVPQPIEFVSPPKWNLAHTSWFFEEFILTSHMKNYKVFHPQYAFLFNSYYNTVGDRVNRNRRGDLSRPTVDEVLAYRAYVDENMNVLLSSANLNTEVTDLLELGLNHEQQHQELFYADLKYSFGVSSLFPEYADRAFVEDTENTNDNYVFVDEGLYEIGYQGDDFCYDNELGRHKVYLHPFEIRKSLVSNGEFLDFLEDGGYQRFEFWHDDALAWLKKYNIQQPLYWHKVDGSWHQFTLAGLRKIKRDNIVSHINYYEAAAFAQWKGVRLPTEFEWEAAAGQLDWGKRWEWTESAYQPYPGFQKARGAVGEYNGKFMVNQKVLRGASVVTPEGHSRKTYRNFFHPHIAYQFNGIRLAK